MKRLFFFLILLGIVFCTSTAKQADSVFVRLDKLLDEQNRYTRQKENGIDSLKQDLRRPSLSLQQQFVLNQKLGEAYELFISDSAMIYFNRSISIARSLHKTDWMNEAQLHQVSVYSVSGMYVEALEMLQSVDRHTLSASLLPLWYNSARQLYSFLISFSHDSVFISRYAQLHHEYRDSLLALLPPASPEYQLYEAERLMADGQNDRARAILRNLMNHQPEASNLYGRAAFSLSGIYKEEGDENTYEKYLALSAISDIKASIKENAALQNLAIALYKQGEINRAYRYIKYSLEDAIFCNARLRTIEISNILPVIDAAYKQKIDRQRKQLIVFLVLVSILSCCLIVAVALIYKQMKKLSFTQQNLKQANHIKEEYIGHFLNLCSIYIEKLDNFRRVVHRKASAGQVEDLLKLTKSSQFAGMEQKEFYANFDNAFLHLYPHFVEELNELLQPEERFVLKSGELLNTELRIFAFIRLGIDDSSKIANFLHYSINTIYTYRNKVKNKAIDRENFEEEILKIGAV